MEGAPGGWDDLSTLGHFLMFFEVINASPIIFIPNGANGTAPLSGNNLPQNSSLQRQTTNENPK